MKKFSLYFFVTLIFCNTSFSQSSLPECEGNDNNISEFSMKHFEIVRKWTNCHGIAIGPKGAKYIGEFYKGKFHGLGTFMKDGRKYVGEYRNHKRHGEGTYTYANGDKYTGSWIKHKYSGNGIYIYANGDSYTGQWKKNKYNVPDNQKQRHGKGIYKYVNGDSYIGEWKNGLRHGKGKFVHSTGKVEEGVWKKNKLVKLKKQNP